MSNRWNLIIFIVVALFAIGSRFFFLNNGESILPNFTAFGALILFLAAYSRNHLSIILPLLALWISDIVLNNVVYASYFESYQLMGSIWVYVAFIPMILFSKWMMKNPSWTKIVGSSLVLAVFFFLITNFGVWQSPGTPYEKNFAGLMSAYTRGIPFFRNTLLSNLFYSFVFFGLYEYVFCRLPQLKQYRILTIR